MRGMILAAALAATAPVAMAQTDTPVAAPAREIARGVHLLPGALYDDRGPDGNTVVFTGSRGLVVVDTGRHVWQADGIVAFARAQNKPVAAIVNTHWHLDHSTGNARVKAAYPNARLYATNAADRALADGGFLARNAVQARASLATISGRRLEETQIFLSTMDHSASLRPDVVVSRSGRMRLAGRSLDVHVTDGAVTDADIWLYDRNTHVAVLGDLVTLPAPFFETACPDQWSAALDAVWATPFRVAIPGHGEPMTRDQFNLYRGAFNAFMDCVKSERAAAECASGWANAVDPLLGAPNMTHADAVGYAEYYVGFLRPHGGKSAECLR